MRNIKVYGRRHRFPCRQGLEDGKSFCIALHQVCKLEHTCLSLCRRKRSPAGLVRDLSCGHGGVDVGCTGGVGLVGNGSFIVGVHDRKADWRCAVDIL